MRQIKSDREFLVKFFETEELIAVFDRWWTELLPTLEKPEKYQVMRWLTLHNFDLEPLRYGLECAAKRLKHMPFNDPRHHLAHISASANRFSAIREKTALRKAVPAPIRRAA
jgi:hypothetical protein